MKQLFVGFVVAIVAVGLWQIHTITKPPVARVACQTFVGEQPSEKFDACTSELAIAKVELRSDRYERLVTCMVEADSRGEALRCPGVPQI